MRVLFYIYIILATLGASASAALGYYPALLWIKVFASDDGTFRFKLVWALTVLTLWAPVFLLLYILKLRRQAKEKKQVVERHRTGIYLARKKHLQNTFWADPVIINNQKVGTVDSGSRVFFDVQPGWVTVQVGKGNIASEKLSFSLSPGMQLTVHAELINHKRSLKYILQS